MQELTITQTVTAAVRKETPEQELLGNDVLRP
jgi:hypothetical protein